MKSQLIVGASQALIHAVRFPAALSGASLRDWDLIVRLAKRANLMGRLAEGVEHSGVLTQLPSQVKTHLESAQALTSHQRQAIAWEVRHIGKALGTSVAPVVLLKGAAYATAGLQAASGRLFGDVDVLVPKELINQAEASLMLLGWASGNVDPYDDRYYRLWMHELPPMTHCQRGTVIDVHHNILPLTARHSPAASMLLENSLPLAGTSFRVLSPCDMVIHSATHLFHEGELQNGLRDLFDLDSLVTEFSALDASFWEELLVRARALGLVWPVHLALRYGHRILQTKIPDEIRKAFGKSASIGKVQQRLLDEMYMRALMPDHPLCSDFPTAIARAGIYLRSHFLRMPLKLLMIHLGRKFIMRLYKNTSRSV